MRKDLRTMVEEGKSLGTDLPVTARALDCYDEASRSGLGKGDITAIPVRWMKLPQKRSGKESAIPGYRTGTTPSSREKHSRRAVSRK
jgi:hypothetical protein